MKVIKIFAIFALLASCSMEPKYHRPQADVPLKSSDNRKEKISRISWQEFFESPDLQRIVQLALDHNRDLKIANLNIESAQALHGVARSDLFPTISAIGTETRQKAPSSFASFSPKKQFRANLTLSTYEIDFFGKLRSLKKSAFEDFLASEQARNIIKITVISETINAYAQLLLDNEILKISEANLVALQERSRLSDIRYDKGLDAKTTALNAVVVMENARSTRDIYKKLVEQDRNALMLLTGVFDEKSLPLSATIDEIKINENLLDFIPSETLLSRPDIQKSEHDLKSANAYIGAARAAFFPSITLTGTYGYGSRELSKLFDSRTWTFSPQINLPIFSGGRNLANLKNAEMQKQIEIMNYEKAIQNAFREAADQLAERESVVSQLQSAEKILTARNKSYDIAKIKYQKGAASLLDKIDSELLSLGAKQNRVSIKKEYIANLISLYKVLGGGSEIEEEI